jgi:hypothetical protein
MCEPRLVVLTGGFHEKSDQEPPVRKGGMGHGRNASCFVPALFGDMRKLNDHRLSGSLALFQIQMAGVVFAVNQPAAEPFAAVVL